MEIKPFALVNLILSSVLISALIFVVMPTSSGGEYDPWVDYNESGEVDIFDAISLAGAFGTSGDPTKQCYITNWPESTFVSVFYNHPLASGAIAYSTIYDANGFTHLHLLMLAGYLTTGEELEVSVYSRLWNENRTYYWPIECYSRILDTTTNNYDVVLYVPSEEFYFRVDALGTTSCEVSLGFYMTW